MSLDSSDKFPSRRKFLQGAAGVLGAMAAAPVFSSIALARDCEGKRCGAWNTQPSEPKKETEADIKFRESLKELVPEQERVANVQKLFDRIMEEHKIKVGRYSVEMRIGGSGIDIDVFEGSGAARKVIGGFSLSTMALQVDGVMANDPQLHNRRAFQLHFRKKLMETFRLTEDK